MANTERFKVLQAVTELKNEVSEERSKSSISESQRALLNDVYNKLEEVQDVLIIEEIKDAAKSLGKHSAGLEKVAEKLKKETTRLEKVAKRINEVAKAISVLAEIVTKASSAGLL